MLYSEYITSTIEITEKLDLTTFKEDEIEKVSDSFYNPYTVCVHVRTCLCSLNALTDFLLFFPIFPG